jgi:hypothetical protein
MSQQPPGMVRLLPGFQMAIQVIRRLERLRACLSHRWESHAQHSADQDGFPGSRREPDTKSEEQHEALVLLAVCLSVAHCLSARVEEPSAGWSQDLRIAHVVPRWTVARAIVG